MKELSSLRMAPPDMIALGKEKGESDKQQEGKKNFCSLLYSSPFNFLSMWSRIDDDTWRFMEKFS